MSGDIWVQTDKQTDTQTERPGNINMQATLDDDA